MAYGDGLEIEDSAPNGAVPLTPGTPVAARNFLVIVCTVAGTVRAVFNDDSYIDYAVQVGTTEIWGKFKDVTAGSTTATATYWVK